jgi:Ca-activated chloride channel homolog
MSFAHPALLLLLVLVPGLGGAAIMVARLRRKRWKAFVADRLRGALLRRSPSFSRWLSLAFLLVAMALMIVAIAGPRGDAGTSAEKVLGRNVLFALDLSRSMRVADVKPDRLAQAKVLIYEMMDAMPNDRMGLIGFGGTPYLFAPLTIDHNAVHETVEQLDETWIPNGGSDIIAALKLSIATLKKTGFRNNALVLISDGEKHDGSLDDVLAEAARSGVYIFTVGVGTEDGDFVPHEGFPGGKFRDKAGNPVISHLHPEILRTIAEKTKGRFALASSGIDIPALARSAMSDLDQFELQGREKKVVVEFYQWLLGPAVLALLISILAATRWRVLAARAAIAAAVAGSVPAAGAATPNAARAALAEGRHAEARSSFEQLAQEAKKPEDAARFHLGEASAAYQEMDFRKARAAYSGALLSTDPAVERNAHDGLGTALFHLGWESLSQGEPYPEVPPADMTSFDAKVIEALHQWMQSEPPESGESTSFAAFDSLLVNWVDAIHHFDSSLKLDPSDQDARQNRTLVVKYLDRLKELLKQETDAAQQSLPQESPKKPPGKGGDEPKGNDGQPKKKDQGKGGEGDKKPKKPPGKGQSEEPKDEGENGDKKDSKNPKDQDGDGDKKSPKPPKEKPGETPRERALRILGDNQDIQKGPLAAGRHEFMRPEKDW